MVVGRHFWIFAALATGCTHAADDKGPPAQPSAAPATVVESDARASQAPLPPTTGGLMNADRLAGILRELADSASGDARVMELSYRGVDMVLVTDTAADRMRLVAPIADASALDKAALEILMAANYHSALDARYAISEGVVFSVYIHPLSPLRESEVRSAVEQVAALVDTFGTSFSSLGVVFGG